MREWLIELRNNRKMTQQVVADKMNISVQQYNHIENGRRQADMNLSTAIKLAEIFKISVKKICEYESLRLGA